MSQQNVQLNFSAYSTMQYIFYSVIGFIIWLSGVILVRLVGTSVFSADSALLLVFFGLSIPIAVITMFVTSPICRLPMRDMLIPLLVMLATTLSLDGLAITFTDIYSADSEMARLVAGWLLWTFGMQTLVGMVMIARANNATLVHP